jgi:hypothetical protein
MAQGDNKTGQKGTNVMFIVSYNKIKHMLHEGKKFTYGNPVINYRPHKDNPHQICIMARGNLIKYISSPSVCTADLDTTKILWNNVISTKGAKYMCLYIKNFYLMAKLEYFEYMQMPLNLFPIWIQNQYNLKQFTYKGYVHLEMRWAVWGLPQAGILANKHLRWKLAPFSYFEKVNTPELWYHLSSLISFTLIVNDFGIMSIKQMLIIWWPASNQLTHSPKIGPATYIAALLLPWIMITGLLTFQCRGTVKRN